MFLSIIGFCLYRSEKKEKHGYLVVLDWRLISTMNRNSSLSRNSMARCPGKFSPRPWRKSSRHVCSSPGEHEDDHSRFLNDEFVRLNDRDYSKRRDRFDENHCCFSSHRRCLFSFLLNPDFLQIEEIHLASSSSTALLLLLSFWLFEYLSN